jgi:hypothetical protein
MHIRTVLLLAETTGNTFMCTAVCVNCISYDACGTVQKKERIVLMMKNIKFLFQMISLFEENCAILPSVVASLASFFS